MNVQTKPPVRREAMRIAGRKVQADETIEVLGGGLADPFHRSLGVPDAYDRLRTARPTAGRPG